MAGIPHDWKFYFTGVDLTADGSTSNTGRSYYSSMCSQGLNLGVGELGVDPTEWEARVKTLIHELGHSIGE